MDGWLYIAACVFIPASWGIASAWIFSRIDARRSKTADEQPKPPVDYMI